MHENMHLGAQGAQRLWTARTAIMDTCELPCVGAGDQTHEYYLLLTDESSL